MTMVYIIAFFILFSAMMLYIPMARRFNIIDKPTERGSHSNETIRGGGIIFPIALLYWFFIYGYHNPWFIVAFLMVAAISFADDIRSLHSMLRMLVHISAVIMLFFTTNLPQSNIPILSISVIAFIAWINSVNFMDGVNGMLGMYALVILGTFYFLPELFQFQDFILIVLIAVAVFLIFNLRKRGGVFAGDVGAISLAFILGFLMLAILKETRFIAHTLMFAVFAIDTSVTILYRIQKRENILLPHRQHLYQVLANQKGWTHLQVSGTYAGIQLLINLTTLIFLHYSWLNIYGFIAFYLILTLLYLWIRNRAGGFSV
jgi:UDP-N-acetylmuramyl pentapeptide phosphotransferase/UDP-N-acetylglucosamine-1-phosphate transferase